MGREWFDALADTPEEANAEFDMYKAILAMQRERAIQCQPQS